MAGDISIEVTDRKGECQSYEIATDGPLMFALRDEAGLPVEGACGGSAACGTCHLFVEPDWRDRLPERQDFELAMLEMLNHFDEEVSRLACQIMVTDDLDGLRVRLAPEE